MRASYSPQEGSTAWKVIEFFTTHPEEELSTADIGAKFDVPQRTVHTHLARAIEERVLKRYSATGESELMYALDQGHPYVRAKPDAHPVLPRASTVGSAPAVTKRRSRQYFDTSLAKIDKGVPLPRRNNALATDWVSLLERMDVQDSVELPLHTRSSLQKCANAYGNTHSKKFSVRKLDDERLRIWRTE